MGVAAEAAEVNDVNELAAIRIATISGGTAAGRGGCMRWRTREAAGA